MYKLESGFSLVVKSLSNLTSFFYSIIIHYLLISWIHMTVSFLTSSYAADRRKCYLMISDYPFDQRKTIGSSILVSLDSIGATVLRGILLISSDLAPEDIWMEAENAWISVVNSGGIRGGRFFSQIWPWRCCQLTYWRHPMIQTRWSSYGEVNFFCPIFQHPHRLHLILKILQIGIGAIIIGLVVDRGACFQDEGLDVLVFHIY